MNGMSKEESLRLLVQEAAWEARNQPVSQVREEDLYAGVFDPLVTQDYNRKVLVDALFRTDALLILDEILNGEPTR